MTRTLRSLPLLVLLPLALATTACGSEGPVECERAGDARYRA